MLRDSAVLFGVFLAHIGHVVRRCDQHVSDVVRDCDGESLRGGLDGVVERLFEPGDCV